MELTKFERINICRQQLRLNRSSYESHWSDISQYLLPYRLRLNLSDYNRGERRNQSILDSTATVAVRTLESGMMTAATDPAGQWFRLTTEDPDRGEFGPHREWLDAVTDSMFSIFNKCGIYTALPTLYGNMAGFGTGVMSIEESFDGKVIKPRVYPTGSYWIGQDDNSVVNTFYREFRWTIRQAYEYFGEDADYSTFMKNAMQMNRWDQWVDVAQMVMPNSEYSGEQRESKEKRWMSCWFEIGQYSAGTGNNGDLGMGGLDNKFLRESGFDDFPFLCGRWEMTEGDTYGINCPGMTAIGDIKTLQLGERRAWQAVEKMVAPHYIAPSALRGQAKGFLPDEVTYLDERSDGKGMRPLYEINPRISELSQKQQEVRERIYVAFYTDLFRMFDSLDNKERTATEIMERKSEKLVQLAPMYGNLADGVLQRLIYRTWSIMERQRIFERMAGPIPPDLQGAKLDIQFLGVLAQAQKGVLVQPTERLVSMVMQIAEVHPEVLDKPNWDQIIDVVADKLGVPASCVNSDEVTQAIRQAKQKAQAAQAMAAAAPQLGKAAKDLSQASLDGNSALTKLVGQ